MPFDVDPDRLRRCYARARELLLAEQTPGHYWVGELSTSALSTATAVMALLQVQKAVSRQPSADSGRRSGVTGRKADFDLSSTINDRPPLNSQLSSLHTLILRGLQWLVDHQNPDGGWGDTVKSYSNISTTMLCHAVLVAVGSETEPWGVPDRKASIDFNIQAAQQYIDRAGGVPALVARYGKDKTFSVPILTHCALAGRIDWRRITPLPFELACLPAKFYKTVRLPVVSYALPALIAIGQVQHHFAPTWNPLTRLLRNLSIEPSLRVLERIQPPNGGFLEATPLTSFVTMSLAAMGRVEHPVVQKGVEFIINSVRPDGSWPIDTNLSTWVTTLAVNALGDDLPEESRVPLLNWLLDQQYKTVHPYTNADPGGWAWTNLPGGVPDADDTPGAMLAVMELVKSRESSVQCAVPPTESPAVTTAGPPHPPTPPDAPHRSLPEELRLRVEESLRAGLKWLLGLQNRDGGWPTFCRGWGTLPFDRSSPDITAHVMRALNRLWTDYRWIAGELPKVKLDEEFDLDAIIAVNIRARDYLGRHCRRSGPHCGSAWLPLWFGNQHPPSEENQTYGTAKVVVAVNDVWGQCGERQAGCLWLKANQNSNGGWGAGPGTPSSVEETALAVEALLDDSHAGDHVSRGLEWLMQRVEAVDAASGAPAAAEFPGDSPRTVLDPAPIGFYFAKLWYFERLYPLIFAVSCLRRAVKSIAEHGERRESAR